MALKRKQRIRVSEISMGMRCPLQYYFLKTIGPRPPSAALVTGTSFHKAMEVNFKEKAKSGLDAPLDVCTDAFNDTFKGELLETEWRDDDPNEFMNKGVLMVKKAKEILTPPIQVEKEEDIERTFIIDCGDFEIKGTCDLKLPEKEGLIDWKTSSKMWYQNRAEKEVQGYLYPLGITPIEEELLPLSFNVLSYAGKTGAFPVQHTREAAGFIVETARNLIRMVKRDEPIVNPYNMYCGEKYCGWYNLCRIKDQKEGK